MHADNMQQECGPKPFIACFKCYQAWTKHSTFHDQDKAQVSLTHRPAIN